MDDGLRAELLRRMEKDQVARKALDHDGMREADREKRASPNRRSRCG